VLEEITRLSGDFAAALGELTVPLERCTTDVNASVTCGHETALGERAEIPQ
jgi:hypothetical protein